MQRSSMVSIFPFRLWQSRDPFPNKWHASHPKTGAIVYSSSAPARIHSATCNVTAIKNEIRSFSLANELSNFDEKPWRRFPSNNKLLAFGRVSLDFRAMVETAWARQDCSNLIYLRLLDENVSSAEKTLIGEYIRQTCLTSKYGKVDVADIIYLEFVENCTSNENSRAVWIVWMWSKGVCLGMPYRSSFAVERVVLLPPTAVL